MLAAGAMVYGLISAQSLVICADHGCQAAAGPGLTISIAALAAAIVVAAQQTRGGPTENGPTQAARRAVALLCVALALVGALIAVLWAGALLGAAFYNFANPWHGFPFLSDVANFLIYGGGSSGKIYWLGWPVGALIELALDVISAAVLAVGATLTARGVRQSWHTSLSKQGSVVAAYVLIITAIAIALDVVVTVPAEAHDAAGFRAAHYIQNLRVNLVSQMNTVLHDADTQDAGDTAKRAKDVGQGDVRALSTFNDQLATIAFPSWVSADLAVERSALADAIVAASDLATAANGSDLAINDAYKRLDDALQRENLADRALYLALFPQADLKIFLQH